MNRHPRARRRLLPVAVAAAALIGALVLTACGSSPSAGTAPGSSASGGTAPAADREQALKYAQCIRKNGVPEFPDPDANGRFRGQSHEQQSNPRFQAAQQACRALAPGGTHEQNVGTPAFVAQARKFAQCIRDNGVPDFPDPDANGQFRGAAHELQGDPKFQAALQACRSKLPGGGAHQGP
jgi:hypothetical protein